MARKRNHLFMAFYLVTMFILVFDVLLVWVNYRASEQALIENLRHSGKQLTDSYDFTLEQISTFMQQTATYIANDDRIQQLFYEGALAVEREGGGAGGKEAARLRQALYELVSDGWDEMARHFKGHQLHFHLPPDVSFLRVHKPSRFGDDLSEIRHSIVAANTMREPTKGFESGRVYSGIRGVAPVFATDKASGVEVHVGALEAGMSYHLMLEQLNAEFGANYAVLISENHARETMWPDFLEQYLLEHPIMNHHLLEASTDAVQANALLNVPEVAEALGAGSATLLVSVDEKPIAVTTIPLRDYLGSVHPNRDDVGTVLVWESADDEIAAFQSSVQTNIIIAMVGFLLIEFLIFWGMRTESRFQSQRIIARTDGLTGISNRHAFEEAFEQMTTHARRHHHPLSILLMDVDAFKAYNDKYGHVAGDRCLTKLAVTIRQELRSAEDFLARFGGEEFVVLLPNTDLQEANRIAERIRAAIEGLGMEHAAQSKGAVVTLSVGVYSHDFRKAGAPSTHLLKHADDALYAAKDQGGNTVVNWMPDVSS